MLSVVYNFYQYLIALYEYIDAVEPPDL